MSTLKAGPNLGRKTADINARAVAADRHAGSPEQQKPGSWPLYVTKTGSNPSAAPSETEHPGLVVDRRRNTSGGGDL